MRLYRWLIACCSPSFRRDYGAAMEETLVCRLADARAKGHRQVARVWLRELSGLLMLIIADRSSNPGRMPERARLPRQKVRIMEGIAQDIRHATRRLWW